MPGANAFVFDGTEFLPSDPASTATIEAYNANTDEYVGVIRAKYLSTGAQIWAGDPPSPTITSVTNTATGSFPNKVSNVTIEWSIDANTIVSHFDVYVNIGTAGYQKHNTSPIAANATSYVYGQVLADTLYSFFVTAVGISTLTSDSAVETITVTGPATITTLAATTENDTDITWTWTVAANTYQSYEVQRSFDGSIWQTAIAVAGSTSGTSFTHQWTSLTQNSNYYLRVRGRNNNGHWSAYSASVEGSTTNTPPTEGTISVTSTAVTSSYATALADPTLTVSTSTSVTRKWVVSVDPSNDPDYFKTELYKSNNGSTGWTLIKTWTQAQGTTAKTYTYEENITSSAVTRYFKTIQYDTFSETVESSSPVSATCTVRRSNVVTTFEAGALQTVTVDGSDLAMFAATSEDDFGTGSTYNWAKTYDGNLNTYWLSDFKNFDGTPATYGTWVYVITPDAGYDNLYSCKINYIEFISFDTRYQIFVQLYDSDSGIWHGAANEPTGVNGNKYVVYLNGGLGNQNTYTRANMNITRTFGNTGAASIAWNSTFVMRNPQLTTISGTSYSVYGILEMRVNYSYRNLEEVNTTYYW